MGGKPVFCWKRFSRGVISVANIMTNSGSLKPWSSFKAEGLNFNDYFLLLGLFNSFPLTWKKLVKDEGSVHTASSHFRNTELTLYKIKLADSPLCSFCNISDESLEHLFCHCNLSIDFWRSVVLWLKTLHIAFDSDSLNDCDIIFGVTQKNSHWLLLNHIIIVGKQVIYHNHLKNSLPSLSHVIVKLNYIESIERSIATKNNRLKNPQW